MKILNIKELNNIKSTLLGERMQMLNSCLHIKDEDPSLQGDEVDHVTREMHIAMQWQLRERERTFLQQIDQALHRIANGTYGKCVECEEALDKSRILARPMATLCIVCQEDLEKSRQSHS